MHAANTALIWNAIGSRIESGSGNGYEERLGLLAGAHDVAMAKVQGHAVLLFDDLYRSGATMNAVTTVLLDDGGATEVFALTITCTRSRL